MVDKQKVEQAIRLLLEGIGEDTEREGLKDTPDRIARMCMEIYGGLDEEADHHLAKQFEVENKWYWKKILLSILCVNII